jgi:hypothetical protein
MTDQDVSDVIGAVLDIVEQHSFADRTAADISLSASAQGSEV